MSPPRAAGRLYVVGTPIGNLDDITIRALQTLRDVSLIAAEDTRVTAKLLARHNISTPTTSILGEGAARNTAVILRRLREGESVALVTDAGTPSVSDPGCELVSAAANEDIPISPIPGPSALAAAVSIASLRGEGIRFIGFLPRRGRRRKELLQAAVDDRALVILYESPRRLGETLRELSHLCPDRPCAILRELTKLHEETYRGTLAAAAMRFDDGTRGEVVIAIEGRCDTDQQEITDDTLRELIREELDAGRSVKDVSVSLSNGLGLPRKAVYEMAVSEMRIRVKP